MAVPPPPTPPSLLLDDSISPSPSGSSLLSTTSTNASSRSGSEDKPWKRPSTIEEIKQSAKCWSLAGDAGLLLYFKQFSQNMLLKTHELEKVVDDLVHDTKGMDAKVHNTFNDFLMLSNKQFIENRVYDEEVVQEENIEKEAAPQQPAKTREQLAAEILPRFSEAVNLGFQVLDDAFITVELKPTDESDDEDEEGLPSDYVPDPIIEPKDMYISRPLPHLIGTAEFFSDESLGLIEIDDDEEGESKQVAKDEEESETSESEEETESDYSESSDEEIVKKSAKKEVVSDDSDSEEESDSDEDLFGDSKKKPISSDESEESEDEEPKPKMDIQAELAAKLGIKEQPPMKAATPEVDDKLDTHSVSSKSTADTQSLISAADTVSIASSVKSKKEKSKHRSESKTSEGHKKHKTHEHKTHAAEPKTPVKSQDDESDEDLFGESKKKNTFEDESPFGKKGGMFSGGGTLFDEDEAGDLFGEANTNSEPVVTEEKQEEPATPTEIKPRGRTTSSGKKIPAGAVSLFGDNALLFGGGLGSPKEAMIKEKEDAKSIKENKKPPPPVKGLFYNEDDDLFAGAPKQDQLTEPAKPKRKKTLELFNDDEDVLFAGKPPSQEKPALTSGKGQEAAALEKPAVTPVRDKPQGIKEAPKKKPELKPKVVSLFDDDGAEEEDWFDNINADKPTTTEKPQTSVPKIVTPKQDASLFSDPEESTVKKDEKKAAVKRPSKSKRVVSLFDEDEDDLFGIPSPAKPPETTEEKVKETLTAADTNNKKEEKIKSPKPSKAKSFIDDDGSGLFGEEQEDLFTPAKQALPKKADLPANKKTKGARFLDDDDDDDDFFGSGKSIAKPLEKTVVQPSSKPKDANAASEVSKIKPVRGIVNDDDLFTGVKTKKESDEKSIGFEAQAQNKDEESVDGVVKTEPNKPKRLAGAVSLFGGIDPFAKNLKSPGKKTEKESSEKEKALFSEKPVTPKPVTVKPDIANGGPATKIQPKIAFNPATLLSGATPPPRTVEAATVSFEEPAVVNALHNATKGRARGQKKRRPPSRHFLQSATTTTDDSETTAIVPPIITSPPSTITQSRSTEDQPDGPNTADKDLFNVNKDTKDVKKSMKSTDIFADDDDLFSTQPLIPATKTKDKLFENVAKTTDSNFDDSTSVRKSNEPVAVKSDVSASKSDVSASKSDVSASKSDVSTSKSDVSASKSDVSASKPDVSASKPDVSASKPDVSASKPDVSASKPDVSASKPDVSASKSDLSASKSDVSASKSDVSAAKFNVSVSKSDVKASQDQVKKTAAKNTADIIFGEPSEDIFKTDSKPKSDDISATSSQSIAKSKENIEDDIFDSSTWKVKVEVDAEKEDLFQPKSATTQKIEAKKDVENILNVDGDLGEPSSEKEPKKTKKIKTEAAKPKEEADDDLFGSPKTKTDDKKETIKKTKKSSRIVTDDDLFGDTGSIFSDIPSKGKEKKKKKSAAGKDIFAKNDEDIFATGAEKKAKTKKKVEKITKPKAAKAPVIDENAANIFDDPLNALGGD